TGIAPTIKADTEPTTKPVVNEADVPLGYDPSQSWPFREKKRASRVRDGKRRGREIEELHVSVLDVEEGLRRMPVSDYLILKWYFIEGYTIDEVATKVGIASRGSMLNRINRIVGRLTDVMNGHR